MSFRDHSISASYKFLSGLLICLLAAAPALFAQKSDTSDKVTINIRHTELDIYTETDSGGIHKFVGNVQLEQNGTFIYCDTVLSNLEKNFIEAFGNVRIIQPGGTEVMSDYLRYTGNNRLAFLKGNVSLKDGNNNLWCEQLNYNVGTKVGTYDQGGTLQSENTTVSSNSGMYNVNTKDTRFTGDVFITDPKYSVVSRDLGYNTNTKVVTFYDSSVVTNDESVLHTRRGTWDSKNEVAHFIARSSLQNDAQYIEADSMDYDRKTGLGKANGNVIAIDTGQKTTLYSGHGAYNELTKQMLATVRPVMKKMNGTDSLFIRADTFFSAPIPRPGTGSHVPAPAGDTIIKKQKGKKGKPDADKAAVKPEEDTTKQRYFIGYHHVIIFSDSLQGRCDSISYSQQDSVMRLMIDPVIWSRRSQVTGDTILLYTDSGMLRKMYVPNNALMVSQSGPDKAQLYDQVQGKTLTGYFVNNTIDNMIVFPSAECIYYAKDDDGAYLGVSQVTSERMRILFREEQIDSIVFEQEVKQTMTPLPQANLSSMKLSRFQWLNGLRPLSLAELFQ